VFLPRAKKRNSLVSFLSAGVLGLGLLGVAAVMSPAASAATLNTQFRGVNWADPRDNFVDGPVVPSGLSTSDDYATTYAKATAVVSGFQTTLGANTVRYPMNQKTTSDPWWNSYVAAFDATLNKGMNVVLAPWALPQSWGTTPPTADFYAMWDTVVNKYGSNSHFYFEVFNEPGAMSEADWLNVAAGFLARYPDIPRSRIIIAGTGYDANVGPVGLDSRFDGTLISLHIYTFNGSHTTEQGWIDQVNSQLGGFGSRTIVTEFGDPMTTGVDYNGARDGDNNRSYLWAVTDTIRSLGMGGIYWPGLRTGDWWSMTTLQGTGTNLSLTVNNSSGLDRLHWAWGMGTSTTSAPATSPTSPTTSPTSPTTTPATTSPSTSPTTPTSGAGKSCTAGYTVSGQWQGGFQGAVTVTAGSSAITGWKVTWTFSNGQTITQSWGATVTTSDSSVTATNASWNGALGAAASTTFGFIGTSNGTNAVPVTTCVAS
jgi:Cellulose binding domain/Cellulase (glycosyl hydrolase family 5)